MIIDNIESALYDALRTILEEKNILSNLRTMAKSGSENIVFKNSVKAYDDLFDSLVN